MKKNLTRLSSALLLVLLLYGTAFPQSDINGAVLYHLNNNKPIPEVVVTLLNSDNAVVATTNTDLNGNYIFPSVPFGSYSISASSSIIPGGSNMADAQKILHHLLGNNQLSPIEQLAADVANPEGIGWEDYNTIIDWFMQGNPAQNEAWVFNPVYFEHTGTKTNVPTMGGSSAGDVNGTFVPTTRNLAQLQVTYTEKPVTDIFNIEILAENIGEASAMGLEIFYPESLVDVSEIGGQLDATISRTAKNTLRITWISQTGESVKLDPGKPVIVLKGNTRQNFKGEEIRFVISNSSHFSDTEGNEIDTRYSIPVLKNTSKFLKTNFPNPFNSITSIEYSIPSDGRATLSLYNQEGRLIRIIEDSYMKAGIYTARLNASDLQPGIYYYRLTTEGTPVVNETRRMVITR